MGKEKGFFISVAILVAAYFINQALGGPVQNTLNPPKVIYLVDTNSRHFCPELINPDFLPYTVDFLVKYKNDGGSGGLKTTVKSNDVVFSDENGNIKNEDSIYWIFGAGEETPRTYHIAFNNSKTEKPTNVTILVIYECSQDTNVINKNCGQGLRCCNYKKPDGYYSSYKLQNEICG